MKRTFFALLALSAVFILSSCVPIVIDITPSKTYTLSGAKTVNVPFTLDDELDIYVNGQLERTVVMFENRADPTTFTAFPGDVLELKVRNTYLFTPCALSPVFLRDSSGNHAEVTQGFEVLICQDGVVFESTAFSIPF